MAAGKKTQSPRRKEARAKSWARGQERHRRNREQNELQHQTNLELRAQGLPTPHEAKKAKRRAQRDALREQGLLPQIGTTRREWLKEKRKAA